MNNLNKPILITTLLFMPILFGCSGLKTLLSVEQPQISSPSEVVSTQNIGQKGDKGDKGDTGLTGQGGIPGLKGDKGDKGDVGLSGQNGLKGDKGDTGQKGDKGDVGLSGQNGLKGDKGDKGDTGLTGLAGQKGDKGDKGDVGLTGQKGDYGEKGDKGDTGLAGLKGDKGDTGQKGDTGLTGSKGDKGEKGDVGVYLLNVYYGFSNTNTVEIDATEIMGGGLSTIVNAYFAYDTSSSIWHPCADGDGWSIIEPNVSFSWLYGKIWLDGMKNKYYRVYIFKYEY